MLKCNRLAVRFRLTLGIIFVVLYKYLNCAASFQVCIGIVYNSFALQLGISIISISTALLFWRYCKILTSFKTLVSKKMAIWLFKKSHSNDKILENTFSSYHMEQKTFIEVICICNIHTEGNFFCSGCF